MIPNPGAHTFPNDTWNWPAVTATATCASSTNYIGVEVITIPSTSVNTNFPYLPRRGSIRGRVYRRLHFPELCDGPPLLVCRRVEHVAERTTTSPRLQMVRRSPRRNPRTASRRKRRAATSL